MHNSNNSECLLEAISATGLAAKQIMLNFCILMYTHYEVHIARNTHSIHNPKIDRSVHLHYIHCKNNVSYQITDAIS